jgi:hypothetical protein
MTEIRNLLVIRSLELIWDLEIGVWKLSFFLCHRGLIQFKGIVECPDC